MFVSHNSYLESDNTLVKPKLLHVWSNIETTEGTKICQSISTVLDNQGILKFSTDFKDFYFTRDAVIPSKELYDFDPDVKNFKASLLKVSDYIYLPKSKPLSHKLTNFKLEPFLYMSKYDYIPFDNKQSQIKPNQLKKTLLYGEYPEEESVILEDFDTFKKEFLRQHTKTLPSTIPICKGFLNLLCICLTSKFFIKDEKLNFFIDELDETDSELIQQFLKKYDFQYSLEYGLITTSSYVLKTLFVKNFNIITYLNVLADRHKLYLFNKLKKTSFFVGSIKEVIVLQKFFFNFNRLSTILYDENIKDSVLVLTSPLSTVELDEGFLLPIKSISVPTESLYNIEFYDN